MPNGAVFLDRDGTIIVDTHYPHKPEDVILIAQAREALLLAQERGYHLEYRKPSPKFMLGTIQSDKLNPEQCWMVGDRSSDWEAGVNAGINSAAVATGKPLVDEHHHYFAQHGVNLYENLYAFAQALPDL